MMRQIKLFLIFIIFVMISGCTGLVHLGTPPRPRVKFYNQTDKNIKIFSNFDYPDTSLENAKYEFRIKKNLYVGSLKEYWTEQIKKTGKVTIFFMPSSFFEEHGEEKAKQLFKPIEKLVLSKEDLEAANWEIFYPLDLNKVFKPVPHH